MADIYEKAIPHQLLSNFRNSKNESFGKFIFKSYIIVFPVHATSYHQTGMAVQLQKS